MIKPRRGRSPERSTGGVQRVGGYTRRYPGIRSACGLRIRSRHVLGSYGRQAIFLGLSKELLGDDGTVGAAVADVTLVEALSVVVDGAQCSRRSGRRRLSKFLADGSEVVKVKEPSVSFPSTRGEA